MKTLSLISILCLSALLAGCGGADKPAGGNSTAANNQTKPADKPASNSTTTEKPAASETTAVTGVPACDEYLAKVEKFVNSPNVPQATKDMYKQTLEQNRSAWKQAASTPQGKAGLETGCKAALDAIKPALEQFNK
jgi:hypothetical protein